MNFARVLARLNTAVYDHGPLNATVKVDRKDLRDLYEDHARLDSVVRGLNSGAAVFGRKQDESEAVALQGHLLDHERLSRPAYAGLMGWALAALERKRRLRRHQHPTSEHVPGLRMAQAALERRQGQYGDAFTIPQLMLSQVDDGGSLNDSMPPTEVRRMVAEIKVEMAEGKIDSQAVFERMRTIIQSM